MDKGFGVIAPSRCGYGRTPFDNGKTYAEQADVYAALLDTLGVDHVVTIGVSAGGPAALQFAARHPTRCKAAMTECAITGNYSNPKYEAYTGKSVKWSMSSPLYIKMMQHMIKNSPVQAVKGMLESESTYNEQEKAAAAADIANDPERMALLQKLVPASYDLPLYPENFETMKHEILYMYKEVIPLQEITVPVMIAHGKCDGDVPFSQAEQAHKLIPNSELFVVEDGWHLLALTSKGKELFEA